jgi:hypothetical protein
MIRTAWKIRELHPKPPNNAKCQSSNAKGMSKLKVQKEKLLICTATLTALKVVIPAKAGIHSF